MHFDVQIMSEGCDLRESDYSKSDSDSLSYSGNYRLENEPQLVEPNEKYKCPICLKLLDEPVQTHCGHRLCRACVPVYLAGEESKRCPVGAEDCENVSTTSIFPDPAFQREIKRLKIYCPNKAKGCTHVLLLRDIESHLKICPWRSTTCRYSESGCRADVALCKKEEHEKSCVYRPVSCELCGQEFREYEIKAHRDECPEALVGCPYNCGLPKTKRRLLEQHLANCPQKPKECRYAVMGCPYKGTAQKMEEHEKDMQGHLPHLIRYSCNVELERRKTRDEAEEMKARMGKLEEKVEQLAVQLKNNYKEIKLKNVGQTERIIVLERKSEELTGPNAALQEEIAHLKRSIEQLKNLPTQMAGFERKLSRHEISMAEMELRFQMIETANYDGILLWKIRDYNVRKRDAVQGRTVSLYSQPFYTSRTGYKMCARVYLNGDGIGRGTHLSLYFVVMKGEYDALLQWPFRLKISLILLDQSPNKRHLKDEFVPDPSSTSFHRPTTAEMNVASGCPLFVSHTVLDNPNNQYVKDDVLFIKVSVDKTQVQAIT